MSADTAATQSPLENLRFTPRDLIRVNRPVLFALFCIGISVICAFRTFGWDKENPGGVHEIYPYVADGWGAWYWLAKLHLDFYVFFFLVSLALVVQLLPLAFPRGRQAGSWPVSIVLLLYVTFWFLFIQLRYGTALALLAPAAFVGGFAPLVLASIVGFLIHRGVVGGVVLLIFWKLLRGRWYGMPIAMVFALGCTYAVRTLADTLVTLAGYANYIDWDRLSAPDTPLKYYYLFVVLALWWICGRRASPRSRKDAENLLILTLLFWPLSYYIVFAGRSFQMYSVVFLFALLYAEVPRFIQILLMVPYVAELTHLFFASGFYFPTAIGPQI
jgi:hypothetical protein